MIFGTPAESKAQAGIFKVLAHPARLFTVNGLSRGERRGSPVFYRLVVGDERLQNNGWGRLDPDDDFSPSPDGRRT